MAGKSANSMKDISLHILDLAQNCLTAGATIVTIEIEECLQDNIFKVSILDNGKGIAADVLPRVVDPYFTTRKTRKVGMGLPLLKQNAEAAGGTFQISSEVGVGTKICAVFKHNHFDRPPLGDIAGVVVLLVGANPEIRFVYTHRTQTGNYTFDTAEVQEALEGLPLNDYNVMQLLKEMINANIDALKSQ